MAAESFDLASPEMNLKFRFSGGTYSAPMLSKIFSFAKTFYFSGGSHAPLCVGCDFGAKICGVKVFMAFDWGYVNK